MNKTFVWPLGRTWPTVAAAIESNSGGQRRGTRSDYGLWTAAATASSSCYKCFTSFSALRCCCCSGLLLLQWPIVVGVGWRGSSRKQFSLKQQQQQQQTANSNTEHKKVQTDLMFAVGNITNMANKSCIVRMLEMLHV